MASPLVARLLRFLPIAAMGVVLSGQASPAQAEPEERSRIDKPFLWRVDGGHKPSYLFGTIHAGVAARELPPIVDAALHASELFVMETSPTQGVARAGGGAQHAAARLAGFAEPMDLSLARHARELGKPIATLETLEFQLSLLAQLGEEKELAALLAEEPEALDALVQAYRSGDLERIAEVSKPDDAHMEEILLNRRNRHWTHRLSRALHRGGVFAAVGVGHMPGEQGLLKLLGDRGYRLRQYPGKPRRPA